jgi:hypothetical protein
MPSSSKPLLIHIWHHPADDDLASQLSDDLLEQGFVVYLDKKTTQAGEISFTSVDWRLAEIDFAIFIISRDSVNTPWLVNDAKKILREDAAKLILIAVDSEGRKNVPILIKFITPLDFHANYDQGLSELIEKIQSKTETPFIPRLIGLRFWKNPLRWIVEHFRRYLLLPPLTFCWRITVENLVVSLSITGLIVFFFQPGPRTNLVSLTAGTFLGMVIVLGPIVETVILQAIPVFIARILGLKFFGQILFSIVPFALLHFSRSVGAGIGAGIIGGFYSAFTYVHWRDKSLWTAFWVTALSHGLYNLAIFAMIIGEY